MASLDRPEANLIEELIRENAALREELREQWETNHFEHCGRDWLHLEGEPKPYGCHWPLPAVLATKAKTWPQPQSRESRP